MQSNTAYDKKFLTIVLAVIFSLTLNTAQAAEIQKDKFLHTGVSAMVEVAMAEMQPFKKWKPWQRALLNVAIIGAGKELYDRTHGGKFDWGDMAADGVGAFLGEAGVRFIGNRW